MSDDKEVLSPSLKEAIRSQIEDFIHTGGITPSRSNLIPSQGPGVGGGDGEKGNKQQQQQDEGTVSDS
jgi:hypothetical protein